MADVKLTKYIDGAGIQALYKKIRAKVTGSDGAIAGNWSADKANNIKITENSGKYWNVTDNTLYLSGYQALNNNYASLISTKRTYITTLAVGLGADSFKDTLHVDAISLGGASTDVLLGNGSSKAISELEVKSATSAKSPEPGASVISIKSAVINSFGSTVVLPLMRSLSGLMI